MPSLLEDIKTLCALYYLKWQMDKMPAFIPGTDDTGQQLQLIQLLFWVQDIANSLSVIT